MASPKRKTVVEAKISLLIAFLSLSLILN